MKDDTQALAQKLGITPSQLERLRHRYTRKHGAKGEAVLRKRLHAHWQESRDRIRILGRSGGYVETTFHSIGTYAPDADVKSEPEAVDPDEIASYRHSREARDAHQRERTEDIAELLGALRDVRSAIDAMPQDKRASISRTLWALKGRIDATEREIRRRLAA